MAAPFLSFACYSKLKAFPMLLILIFSIYPGVFAFDCTNTSIGVENKYIIPDSSFTASSAMYPFGLPFNGRLNATYGWAAKTTTNSNDYLQVDLGFPYVICAVITQGRGNGDEWVIEYNIRMSMDNKNWTSYKENGADKIFAGNTNRNSYVKNPITKTRARYIRFYPTKYKGSKVMRVGIFGYKKECATNSINLENKYIIPDSSFTASSYFSIWMKPYFGRLSHRGWAAKTNSNPNDYLQVDLGIPYFICAIATAGNSRTHEWILTYKISVSLNNKDWLTYQENGINKVFQGNSENTIVLQHSVNNQLARYIRFIPVLYHSHKTMRIGVFGYKQAGENVPLGMESGAIQDGSITASSAQHPAKNARLHYTSGSSWCASTSDSNPYLQIDLGSSHLICAVATQGNSIADQWVKTYQIDTSTDGTTWTTYQENNTDRTFYGNYDRSTVARRVLYHGIVTRYLRIVPKTYNISTATCLRTEIYGYHFQKSCSTLSVGIPARSLVPNHRFTATSNFNTDYYASYGGRLGAKTSSWASKTNLADDYLQIDLGDMFYVCAVATQGNSKVTEIEYVKKYKVMYSRNDIQWKTYNESGAEKEFQGNINNAQLVVTNSITNPFKAKFVRILPTAYHAHKTMRVDFKGLPSACTSSLGLERLQIPDSQITSSSSSDDSHNAARGRLYGKSSWCTSSTSDTEYIQVDLGQVKTVTGIATQGDKFLDKWVTSFKVRYSFDNRYWEEYKEFQVSKAFRGSTNRKDVVVQWLPRPIAARYVRICLQAWQTGICIRFDLYGCEFLDLPKAAVDIPQVVLSTPKSSKALTCRALGEPTPDIQWFNNGTKINGATQSTLQVQFISAEDVLSKYNCTRQDPNTRAVVCNTFYTCRATYPNYVPSGGMDEASVNVTVNLNVPQSPTVKAVPFQRSIRLSWTLPTPSFEVGAITNCLIDVIELNNQNGSLNTISVGHQASPFALRNLRPYTNYNVRMSVISTVGQGLWSKFLAIRTMIGEPDCIPTITSLVSVTSQSIRVNWQLNDTDKINGPMTGYRIKYAKEEGPATMIVVGTVTTYTLTSLEKNTIYKVTVSAMNSLYTGNSSVEIKTRTLEDAPECAPVLKSVQSLSSNSVLLIWSSLQNQKCTNGLLRGYKVVYRESKKKSNPLKVFTVSCLTAKTAIVTGLAKSVQYEFQVRAFTVKDGPLSNSLLGKVYGQLMILTDKMTSIVKAALTEKVVLSCYATGAQPIRYIWTKDGSSIKGSSTKVIDNTVIVQPSNLQDYGTFLCKASSGKEVASYEIKLVPYKECLAGSKRVQPQRGKLAILSYKMTSSIKVAIGNKVTIGCFATGPQPITYKWTKNGARISNPAITVIDNILFIKPKTARDYGRYLCSASNSNDTVSFATEVKPLKNCGSRGGSTNSPKVKLTISRNKMMPSVNVAIGNKAAIGCYATGVQPIKYQWTRENAPISSSAAEVIDNILFVKPTTSEDYGKYRCRVSNKNETDSYVIEVKPLINCVNETNQEKLRFSSEKMTSLVRASIGDKVSLGCYATGAPPIKYSWTKDDSSLVSSRKIQILQNVLVVYPKRSSDYGTYVCGVTNGKETTSYTIELLEVVAGKPESLKSSRRHQENTERTYLPPFVIVLALLVIVCILITVYLFWRQRRGKKKTSKELGIPMSAIIRKNSLGQERAFLMDQGIFNETLTQQVAENEI